MRLLFAANPARGHLLPMLPLAIAAVAAAPAARREPEQMPLPDAVLPVLERLARAGSEGSLPGT